MKSSGEAIIWDVDIICIWVLKPRRWPHSAAYAMREREKDANDAHDHPYISNQIRTIKRLLRSIRVAQFAMDFELLLVHHIEVSVLLDVSLEAIVECFHACLRSHTAKYVISMDVKVCERACQPKPGLKCACKQV